MREIARLPESDRRELFRATAQAMRVHEAIVEKDFWVCWALDYTDAEPWAARSANQQDIFGKTANQRAAEFLAREVMPTATAELSGILGASVRLKLRKQKTEMKSGIYFSFQLFSLTGHFRSRRSLRSRLGLVFWSP